MKAVRSKLIVIGMKRTKVFLIGMDLVAPGVGQLFAGMWLRGALELLAAIACLLWALVEVVAPLALSVRNLISGDGEILPLSLWRVGASIALLLSLYAWSVAELVLFYKDPEDAKTEPPSGEGSSCSEGGESRR